MATTFINPNDNWRKRRKKSEEDLMKAILITLALCILWVVIGWLLSGCTTTKYVTVPEVHEVHHHHTDSVFQRDSVVKESLTTVMQLDSAAMADYGIQLKAAERAWLVRTAELERQLQRLSENHTDTVHEVDSIPVPYPVEVVKEVEKPLTWWQRTKMYAGMVLIMLLMSAAAFGIFKFLKKIGVL